MNHFISYFIVCFERILHELYLIRSKVVVLEGNIRIILAQIFTALLKGCISESLLGQDLKLLYCLKRLYIYIYVYIYIYICFISCFKAVTSSQFELPSPSSLTLSVLLQVDYLLFYFVFYSSFIEKQKCKVSVMGKAKYQSRWSINYNWVKPSKK